MPILINRRTVQADIWRDVADDGALPMSPVVVTLARWLSERESLRRHVFPVGVRLENTEGVQALAPDLERIALVILEFPVFTDGRAYSQARLLRQRLGFRGEIRATGAVARDQLLLMARCGFDTFLLPDSMTPESALAALREISVDYQPWLEPASGRESRSLSV